jgi:hypothetical protein
MREHPGARALWELVDPAVAAWTPPVGAGGGGGAAAAAAAVLAPPPPNAAVPLLPFAEPAPCFVCGRTDGAESLMLCDGKGGTCESTAHTHCVGLAAVPEGDWFCPACGGPPAPERGGGGGAAGATRLKRHRRAVSSDTDDDDS